MRGDHFQLVWIKEGLWKAVCNANDKSEDTTNQVDDTNENVVKKYKAHIGHMDLVAKEVHSSEVRGKLELL